MEKNSNKKYNKKLIYRICLVASAVCICAGVVSINAIRTRNSAKKYDISINQPEKTQTPSVAVEAPKANVPKNNGAAKRSDSKSVNASKPTAAKPAEQKSFEIENLKIPMPVSGTVAAPHSGDELVYNKIFDDWRVHSGVDITAEPSSQVKAVYDGKVEDVTQSGDGSFVITIDHKYFKSVYSGVSTDKLIEKGKDVKSGDVISGISDKKTLYDLPHMTFEVIYQGKSLDPAPLFKN